MEGEREKIEVVDKPTNLKFDSNFESGNLDMVIKHQTTHDYDLFIRTDTNSQWKQNWFYFRI